MLVDKEVMTKAVPAPEPAATVPKSEVAEEPRASSLGIGPPTEPVGETGAVFQRRKFAGDRGGCLIRLQCNFRLFPIHTAEWPWEWMHAFTRQLRD